MLKSTYTFVSASNLCAALDPSRVVLTSFIMWCTLWCFGRITHLPGLRATSASAAKAAKHRNVCMPTLAKSSAWDWVSSLGSCSDFGYKAARAHAAPDRSGLAHSTPIVLHCASRVGFKPFLRAERAGWPPKAVPRLSR